MRNVPSNAEKFEDAILNLGNDPTSEQVESTARKIDSLVKIEVIDGEWVSYQFSDSSVSEQDIVE